MPCTIDKTKFTRLGDKILDRLATKYMPYLEAWGIEVQIDVNEGCSEGVVTYYFHRCRTRECDDLIYDDYSTLNGDVKRLIDDAGFAVTQTRRYKAILWSDLVNVYMGKRGGASRDDPGVKGLDIFIEKI